MFKLLEEAYSGKRVFLTGHTGFKGAWLLKILNQCGAQVRGYALAPQTDNDLYNLISGDELCDSVIADLRQADKLCASILDYQPDYIFHLAAQPLVKLSYEIPRETFEINAIGTAYLLEAVRKLHKTCQVILITTDKVYHNNEWIYPYRENDRLGGYDPYSASKACAELIIDSYRNSFFNLNIYEKHKKAIAVCRAGNVIGGGDWAKDRLIPDIVSALYNKEVIKIRNPNAVRPWQHVLEPLSGYLLLGTKLFENPIKYSQAFNFGPGLNDTLSVKRMVDIFISNWNSGSYELDNQQTQLHEAGLLKLDISKAISELSWEPKMEAIAAVRKTTEWYKAFQGNKDCIDDFTTNQIFDYFKATYGN